MLTREDQTVLELTRRCRVFVVAAVLTTLPTGILCGWYLFAKVRDVEGGFRMFMWHIGKSDYVAAYSCTSERYREEHTVQEFAGSGWCSTSSVVHDVIVSSGQLQKIYVRRFNPIDGKASVISTSATLVFPLVCEDGLIGVCADLVQESGVWKIDSEPETVMR